MYDDQNYSMSDVLALIERQAQRAHLLPGEVKAIFEAGLNASMLLAPEIWRRSGLGIQTAAEARRGPNVGVEPQTTAEKT